MNDKINRLRSMARDAIQQYSDELFGGGEPAYPQWTRDLLDVLNNIEVPAMQVAPKKERIFWAEGLYRAPRSSEPVRLITTTQPPASVAEVDKPVTWNRPEDVWDINVAPTPPAADDDDQRCTCHPDDRPEGPCRRQYAATDCRAIQPSAPKDPTSRFMLDVVAELKRARTKFPGSRIMTIALAEEFGELVKAMLDEPGTNVWKEAVQTAVMAARVAIDGDSSVDEWRTAKGLDDHRLGGRP